jgi:hypothetical protein
MAYDPRMMQQGGGFQQNRWWEQPQQRGQSANLDEPASQSANSPKPQPSLLDMLMSSGLMKKQGGKTSGNQALDTLGPQGAMFSPLWLGSSMGLPGGGGWGGPGVK